MKVFSLHLSVISISGLMASPETENNDLELEARSINDGLVLHLPFDEGSGTIAHDALGNHDAQLHNHTQWASGYLRQAVQFDGSDDYISLGDEQLGLDEVDEFTITFWIKPGGGSVYSNSQTIVKKGTYVYPFWIDLQFNQIRTCIRTDRTHYLSANQKLGTDIWYHIALTYGNNTRSIYINGEPQATDEVPGDLTLKDDQSIEIGRSKDKDYLNARLDEFRYYNRALQESEIRELADVDNEDPIDDDPEPEDFALSQHGITWTFSEEVQHGQFANGDHWVVGPVEIVSISPVSVEENGTWTTIEGTHPWSGPRTMHGSMINPDPGDGYTQGYDSEAYAWHPGNGRIYGTHYDSSLNVALNVSEENPLTIDPGNSLVSTISVEYGHRPQLESAAILTVLGARPPEGAFRPPYSGTDKTIRFNVNQLAYSLLGTLPQVSNTPSVSEVARSIARPWIDHVPNWVGRYIHPADNMPDYGREIAIELGRASLLLQTDLSNSKKEEILISLVQKGIDFHGVLVNGGQDHWVGNGGHMSGRLWPILFAGLMLNDGTMSGAAEQSGDYLYSGEYGPGNPPPDYVHFGELDQTFYVTQQDVDRTNGPQWAPHSSAANPEPYETSDIGMPEWGISHSTAPYRDNKEWPTPYRQRSTAISWSGHVLSALIMGVKGTWNHDAVFDYMDRYIATETDSVFSGDFERNMWETYRDLFE